MYVNTSKGKKKVYRSVPKLCQGGYVLLPSGKGEAKGIDLIKELRIHHPRLKIVVASDINGYNFSDDVAYLNDKTPMGITDLISDIST